MLLHRMPACTVELHSYTWQKNVSSHKTKDSLQIQETLKY